MTKGIYAIVIGTTKREFRSWVRNDLLIQDVQPVSMYQVGRNVTIEFNSIEDLTLFKLLYPGTISV